MMNLPKEEKTLYEVELDAIAEEKKMPFMSTFERRAKEKGMEEGRKEGRA